MEKKRFVGMGIIVLLAVAFALPGSALADCQDVGDTADGGDVITCTGEDPDGYTGTPNSDEITVEAGAFVARDIFNRSISPGNGNNTVINNGTIDGNVNLASSQGNNEITNNATIKQDIYLDGSTGNNNITNNGTVDYIDLEGSTGTNTVTNNETVGNDIVGGDATDEITNNGTVNFIETGSGDDTITNSDTVSNNIDAGNGDDTVTLTGEQPDVQGNIDGGEGGEDQGDTLEFNMSTADEAQFNQAKADIAAADPDAGTLNWGASTFNWFNFETLVDNLQLIVAANGNAGDGNAGGDAGGDDGDSTTYADVYVSVLMKGGTLYFLGKNGSSDILLASLNQPDYAGASAGQVLVSESVDELGVLLYVEVLGDGQLLVQYYATDDGSLLTNAVISV